MKNPLIEELTEVVQDLLDVIDAAIASGDWKVDGACDPDLAIVRAQNTVSRAKNP